MSDIITERSDGILRVEFNRPAQKNAMTASMYTSLADILREADKDETVRVVLWHGAGDAFCAGNDIGDFLKNPPGPGETPQSALMRCAHQRSKSRSSWPCKALRSEAEPRC